MTERDISSPIYWVGGSKGGVGKSMMSMAVLDRLWQVWRNVLLVECDASAPDVGEAYRSEVPTEFLSLDEERGWIDLVNTCTERAGSAVVVNGAPRDIAFVQRFGPILDASLTELGRELVTFWVINRQRDSLDLLRDFMEAMPHAAVHVVRNGHFGDEDDFQLYNASPIRDLIERLGGQSLTLPALAPRVADEIYIERLSLASAAKTLSLGSRAELARWRAAVTKILEGVVPPADEASDEPSLESPPQRIILPL
jgi:hypothetical protein